MPKPNPKLKKYSASPKGRARAERYRISVKGKAANRRYVYSAKGIAARKRAMDKFRKNKLNYRGYRQQVLECDKTGNRFRVIVPYLGREILVCLKYKTYCHSKACIKERLL